ncbi:MAG: dTMP kinase [Clostridia bacterium]|nr:dTMP kinase [Clostridia bacterium]
MDGCGKTTQLNLLTRGLEQCGYEVVHSREPGGCPISEKIRELVLDKNNIEMCMETEALLYAASRAQHVRQVIRPTMAAGKLLLCDRFVDSSVAYQGAGRELGTALISAINAPAVDGTMPDATVFLSIDRKEALRRRCAATDPDRIELAGDDFHSRVEAGYHQLIDSDPRRWIVVDASRTPEEIADEVLTRVLDRLEEVEA